MSTYANLFKSGMNNQGGGLNFINNNPYNSLQQLSFGGGYKDQRFDLSTLAQVVINNPTWFGIFQKIEAMVKVSGFEVYEIKNDGKKQITRPAKEYKQLLINAGLKKMIQNMIVAGYGLGLGGGIGYKTKENGKIKLHFDPYTLDGIPRVAFWGDKDRKTANISEVEILDQNAQKVHKFDYKDIYHYQFSNPNATNAFGTNGVVVAAKWMKLEYVMMTANDQVFTDGLQVKKVASLDSMALKNAGVNQHDIQNSTELLKKRLQEANGVQNAGKMLFLPFPMNFQDISVSNNSQMRTTEMLSEIEKRVHKAMGVDQAILDTSLSKYNNIDQAVDLLYQAVQSFIVDLQELVENWALPTLDPKFDNTRFCFRIPRQFSQEEIKLKEVNDKAMALYWSNLKVANESLTTLNLAVLPTPDKLKYLQEQGMTVETLNKETIEIKPSTENQTVDDFTQITNSENVRTKQDFYSSLENRLDTSFKKLFDNA